MEKVNRLLHEKHFFGTAIWTLWNTFSYCAIVSVFPMVYGNHDPLVKIISGIVIVVCIIVGATLANLFLQKPAIKVQFIASIIWSSAIPATMLAIDMIFFDAFYDFGGIFPGLQALGLWIELLFYLAVALIPGVVWCIVYAIKCAKKTAANIGVYKEGKKSNIIIDVLNWIIIAGVILATAYFVMEKVRGNITDWHEKRTLERNEIYATEYYKVNTSYTEDDLYMDAYSYVLICEMLATETDGSTSDSFTAEFTDSLNTIADSKVREAITVGTDRLKDLLSENNLFMGVDTINSQIKYDYRNKNVSFWYEMALDKDNSVIDYWAVVTFDEKMNIDIKYAED